MWRKREGLRLAAAAAVVLAVALGAAAPALAINPIDENWRGIAIRGYDAVAYFTDGKPVEGSSEYTAEWKDAIWRFASAAHRDQFVQSPKRYAPQYGGYCAWAVANNDTTGSDPEVWKIVDGKLYLNASREVQAKWEEDVPGNIEKADRNWPTLLE